METLACVTFFLLSLSLSLLRETKATGHQGVLGKDTGHQGVLGKDTGHQGLLGKDTCQGHHGVWLQHMCHGTSWMCPARALLPVGAVVPLWPAFYELLPFACIDLVPSACIFIWRGVRLRAPRPAAFGVAAELPAAAGPPAGPT